MWQAGQKQGKVDWRKTVVWSAGKVARHPIDAKRQGAEAVQKRRKEV